MIKRKEFKGWLESNTNYSEASINDVVSRMVRADRIFEWTPKETYVYYLERNEEFEKVSVSVKSQIRKAAKLYFDFYKSSFPDEIEK